MLKYLSFSNQKQIPRVLLALVILFSIILSSCAPAPSNEGNVSGQPEQSQSNQAEEITPTPLPTRPLYSPGDLVDYEVQSGDTLPALAVRFNTSEAEIREANAILPDEVTTLPPGLPMKIPIYYEPLWGSAYQIIPDSLFPNGPADVGFDTVAFVDSMPGWLRNYHDVAGGVDVRGGKLIELVATNFSISPRLLLAIVEYQTGALTEPVLQTVDEDYILGYQDRYHKGLYQQLIWTANTLNNGYYGWRTGKLDTFKLLDGRIENPDPWQNAATVAIHYLYSQTLSEGEYETAVHSSGLAKTYTSLFGDPWENPGPEIPGSLQQPEFLLPFEPGNSWAFTGGPHTGWGEGLPFSALDFAPPSNVGGCSPSTEWSVAVADGVIVRKETGLAMLDLDMDGDERTGWVILYLHLETKTIPPVGTKLQQGDPIGYPSCEGGSATGTHIHIARKYNGEWISAGGPLAFNLEGWVAQENSTAYQGELVRFGNTVRACDCSDKESQIQAAAVP